MTTRDTKYADRGGRRQDYHDDDGGDKSENGSDSGSGSDYSDESRSYYSSEEAGSSRSGSSNPRRVFDRRVGGEPIKSSWWDSVFSDFGCGHVFVDTDAATAKGSKRHDDCGKADNPSRTIKGSKQAGRRVTEHDVLAELVDKRGDSSSHSDSRLSVESAYTSDSEHTRTEKEGKRGSRLPRGREDDGGEGRGGGVGPDGVKLIEDEAPPKATDGGEYPSISVVKREFKRMIVSLKDGNNIDREKAEELLKSKYELLEEARKNPSPLYRLNRAMNATWVYCIIYFCIAVVGITSGLETSREIASHPALRAISLTVSIVFALECAAKISCAGVMVQTEDGKMHLIKSDPRLYFADLMNCLDFFIVVINFSDYFDDVQGGSSLMVLRLLRLARVLKVVTVIPELQVILSGVAEGCKSIGWILLLLSAVVYIYSILGVMLFRLNDPRNFRNLGVGISTVLTISTGEFVDYLFISYYGCDMYGYGGDEDNCTNPSASGFTAAVYFISLILIVGQIMMSLFIGVITNKMEEAALSLRETKTERKRLAKARKSGSIFSSHESAENAFEPSLYKQVCVTLNIISGKDGGDHDFVVEDEKASYVKHPLKQAQYLVLKVIKHWTFESFVVLAIVVAGVETGIETSFNVGEKKPEGLEILRDVVLGIFVVELALKMFVVIDRPRKFVKGEQGKWNIFDLVVVIFALVPSKVDGLATVIRLARLLRLLKLIRHMPQLQVVIFSLMKGMASIVYVAILMGMTFYVYGIAGVHLFRDNDPFHFNDLATAFLTLFRISMMEDWRTVVDIQVGGCALDAYNQDDGGARYAEITGSDPNDPLCTKSKGLGFLAMFYFFTFILFSALVLVSVFVGIIVTGMQDATERMKVETDRRRRAALTKKHFNMTDLEVKAMNTIFEVLDADGSEELMISELHQAMDGLRVDLSRPFLRKVVDVFAEEKDGLDVADFLLLVMLCKRAIDSEKEGESAALTERGDSFNSDVARQVVEGLQSAHRSAAQEEAVMMRKTVQRIQRKVSGKLLRLSSK